MDYIQKWPQFGPWIAFKVADMLDRLDIVPIQFKNSDVFLFKSPLQGAKLLWSEEGEPSLHSSKDFNSAVGNWAVSRILSSLGHHDAPPRYERKINCQEAETILCKWH